MNHPDAQLHTLVGPYVLDALDPEERELYERHLARCDTCAYEIRELRETAARLAAAATTTSPAAMKQTVLASAARTRQLPPRTTSAESFAHRRLGRRVNSFPAATGAGRFRNLNRLRKARVGRSIALATFVAALAAFIGFSAQSPGHPTPPNDPHIAAVLTAPDAITLTAPVRNGGTSTIVMSPRQADLVFAAKGLAPLPKTKCYMLWLIRARGDTPALRLPPAIRDLTGPAVASGIQDHDHLGLTIEPNSGSTRPTTPMLIDIPL
jgi:anti-sigma factor RsiW